MTPEQGANIFVSYSHRDSDWREKLELFLKPLERRGALLTWCDASMPGGATWKEEIANALAAANVAILLVSPHFLASDFIAEHELPVLFTAAREGRVRILWIAVSASGYEHTDIVRYQAVNDPTKPLDELSRTDLNRELVKIANKIERAARSIAEGSLDIVPDRMPELRPNGSRPSHVRFVHTVQGMIGGALAGIYISLRYYSSFHDLPPLKSMNIWWWLQNSLLDIGFSCAVGALGGASILYFMSRFHALHKNPGFWSTVLLDVLAAGMGAGSTAVVAGIFAAISFGERANAPPASPLDLLIGVGVGTVFICAGVLQSKGNALLLALASSGATVVIVFCLLIFFFTMFSSDKFLRDYFNVSDVPIMVFRGMLVGVAAGLLIGVQIALSRQVHRYLWG